MLLRNTIQKTKLFFHKTFQNLKSFLFGGYQKLPKTSPQNISTFNNRNSEMQKLDQFYKDFSERWPSDHNKSMRKKNIKNVMSMKKPTMNLMKEEDGFTRSSMRFEEHRIQMTKHEERGKEEKKMGSSHEEKKGNQCSDINVNEEGGYVLAKKMKELEMMNVNDMDHVLDIEEVLHYYSRLTCPVYLDIVDKFFMDMYSEFFLPQPSISVHNSMRRLGPVKF